MKQALLIRGYTESKRTAILSGLIIQKGNTALLKKESI